LQKSVLRNQKGNRHYLVVITHSKKADLRAVADQIGDGKLSFGSPERLMTHLGLTPGSVSPFGLINDRDRAVRVVLDRDLKSATRLSFHPNINTSTFVVSAADFARFLEACGNPVQHVTCNPDAAPLLLAGPSAPSRKLPVRPAPSPKLPGRPSPPAQTVQ